MIIFVVMKKENIIFLDFDGVFILNDEPCIQCIKNLNKIIRKTNSKIIITSDWRKYHKLDKLQFYFKEWGIKGDIKGVTVNLWPLDGHISMIEEYRRNEIKLFITNNNIKNHVIIDDLILYENNENFFNTLFYKGITNEIAINIINKLSSTTN